MNIKLCSHVQTIKKQEYGIMGEADNADLVTDFINDQEVINMRKEAGFDIESSEVLSMISKHKIW